MRRSAPPYRAQYGKAAGAIVQYCTDNGLFVGAPASKQNIIRLLPPFIVTAREVHAALDILDRAIFTASADAVLKQKVMAVR